MRNASLAALVCLLALSASAKDLPLEEEWLGFTLAPDQQSDKPAESPQAVGTQVYFDPAHSDKAAPGQLKWDTTKDGPQSFDYTKVYSLYTMTQQDIAQTSTFTKKASVYKLFRGASKDPKTHAVTVRLAVANASSPAEPKINRSFVLPVSVDLNTEAGRAQALAALAKTLDAKPLKDWVKIPAGYKVAIDPPATNPGPPASPAGTQHAEPDSALKQAIANLCSRAVLDKNGAVQSSTPQCKPSEPAFFYQALVGADAAGLRPEEQKRLKDLRATIMQLGAKPWTGSQDPPPINVLRSEPSFQKLVADYINKDANARHSMQDSGVTDDQVLEDFCSTFKPNGDGYHRAMDELKSANANAGAALAGASPENAVQAAAWDKSALSGNCDAYRTKNHHPDARTRTFDFAGGPPAGGGGPQTTTNNNDSVFVKAPDAPAKDPPTNPYKQQINGLKWGVWGAILGFIFGGPAGALLIGAAAAGAGYYISGYKNGS